MSPETLQWVQPFSFFFSSHVDASHWSIAIIVHFVSLCDFVLRPGMLAVDWR